MDSRRVRIVRLPGCVQVPTYKTAGASGMDVYAARPVNHTTPDERRPWEVIRADGYHELTFSDAGVTLNSGSRALIPSGVAMAIPPGFEIQIRSRSGNAWKRGLVVTNSPATIDADYRGPIGIVVTNTGGLPVTINPGDRIAQFVLAPVVRARLVEVEELPETERGSGGFGSTG